MTQAERASLLTHRLVQTVLVLVIAWMVYRALAFLMPVVAPVLIAFFLAYLMAPFVDGLERRGLPRWIGFLVLMVALLLLVLLVIFVIVPLISEELSSFVKRIPGYMNGLRTRLMPWVAHALGSRIPSSQEMVDALVAKLQTDLTTLMGQAYSPLKHMAFLAAAGTYFLLSLVTMVIIVPFFTYYIIEGYPKLASFPFMVVPRRYHDSMRRLLDELHHLLSSWFRGQLLVMLILGTLYSIAYSLIGLPLALVVGLLTGFLAFIPYIGAFVGFILAVLLSLLKGGIWPIFFTVLAFGVVQTLDALFVTPKILGRSVEMNPAVVVFVLMFFGYVWGFWGALVAVPLSAALKVVATHLLEAYHSTTFYGEA